MSLEMPLVLSCPCKQDNVASSALQPRRVEALSSGQDSLESGQGGAVSELGKRSSIAT